MVGNIAKSLQPTRDHSFGRRLCLVIAAASLFAGSLAAPQGALAVGPSSGPSVVCSDGSKGDTLTVRIQFSPAATDPKAYRESTVGRLAKDFKRRGQAWFNAHAGGLRLKLEVGTRGMSDPIDPSAHQIAVTADQTYRSTVESAYGRFGQMFYGRWSVYDLTNPDPRAGLHEVGHLAGLHDQYTQIFKRGSEEIPIPDLMETNDEGSVVNPVAWVSFGTQHKVDVFHDKVSVTPFKGHENDLMGNFDTATRLHPDWVSQLRGYATECNRSVLREVESARTCYTAPKDLPVKGYQPYLPFLRIANAATAVDRYPAIERRNFPVRIACSFKNERTAIIELLDWATAWVTKGNQLNAELTRLQPDLTNDEYRELDRRAQQASLNAGALGTEAIYRSTVVLMLAARDKPGYSTVSDKRLDEMLKRVVDFVRNEIPRFYS
mgnify:CR=1 FL=1